MTLHWWMHWFWVTMLLILLGGSLNHAAPQSEELQRIITDTGIEQTNRPERQGRAMYFPKTPQLSTKPPDVNKTSNIRSNVTAENVTTTETPLNKTTDPPHPSVYWTPINTSDVTELNVETTQVDLNLTVPTIAPEPNVSDNGNASKKTNVAIPDYVKDESNLDGVPESRIVTEKPLSLETSFLQTRIPPNIESYRRIVEPSGMDTGAIAGISFAALVLGALAGSTAFVLYRRRYLNKPQTLNDKCSNPDSSGYLDDSTVRDNSEEMYSLDNDSFLNSLEAMTIQNYWTDTVKHTKL